MGLLKTIYQHVDVDDDDDDDDDDKIIIIIIKPVLQ